MHNARPSANLLVIVISNSSAHMHAIAQVCSLISRSAVTAPAQRGARAGDIKIMQLVKREHSN